MKTGIRTVAARAGFLALIVMALAAPPVQAGDLCAILDLFDHWELVAGDIEVHSDSGCDLGVDVGGGGGPDKEPAYVGSLIRDMPGAMLYEFELSTERLFMGTKDRLRIFQLGGDKAVGNLFEPGLADVYITQRWPSGEHYLVLAWESDDESDVIYTESPIAPGGSMIGVEWHCSTAAGVRDGAIRLTIDGTTVAEVQTLIVSRSPHVVRFGRVDTGQDFSFGTVLFRPHRAIQYYEPRAE